MTKVRLSTAILFILLSSKQIINVHSATNFDVSERNRELAATKCQEYIKPLNKNFEILQLIAGGTPQVITVPICDEGGEQLIVGGEPARDGEFPHMAVIGYQDYQGRYHWNCGGTLISENYVLTAAHCQNHRDFGPASKVLLGLNDFESSNPNLQDYNVETFIRHPNYRRRTKYHDIGLIKLNRNVIISKKVRPACLFTDGTKENTNVLASGWGLTENAGSSSTKLLKVGLQVFSNNVCQNKYKNTLVNGVSNQMICAGYSAGGKDTCNGDSGGPLMITKENNHCIYYVIGVTSFGKYCGLQNLPSIYTNVSSYVDWIADIIW